MENIATQIFTSPELRCIETARSIQRSLHIDNWNLCVEPSLAEYARFRDDAQKYWLTTTQVYLYLVNYFLDTNDSLKNPTKKPESV